jgi:hypothetical protein
MAAIDRLDNGDAFAGLMRRPYMLLLRQGWEAGSSAVGVDLAFDLANENVQRILKDLLIKIKGVAETTKDDIRRMVGEAAASGWSIEEFAAQIRAKGLEASKTRSEAIAVTATAEGYSRGSLLYYKESGVVEKTEWLLTDNPCPICEEIVASRPQVLLDEEFADGVFHPPAHPRCRCAIAPILSEVT